MKKKTAWNKGLTKETDERVRSQAERMIKNKTSPFCTLSQATIQKRAESLRNTLRQNPEKTSRDKKEAQRLSTISQKKNGKYTSDRSRPGGIASCLAQNRISSVHKLLAIEMQNREVWLGFNNEVEFKYGCIDIANTEKKIAIYVDGDYWHGNPEKFAVLSKAQKNKQRLDKSHTSYLRNRDWIVLRFWENDIKNNLDTCMKEIAASIRESS